MSRCELGACAAYVDSSEENEPPGSVDAGRDRDPDPTEPPGDDAGRIFDAGPVDAGGEVSDPDAGGAVGPPLDGGPADAGTEGGVDDEDAGTDEDAGADEDAGLVEEPQCDALTLCTGECVDLSTNPSHCGECELACGDGEQCSAGACLFDPGSLDELVLWLRADVGVVLEDGAVATWQDSSPAQNHASQEEEARRPTVGQEGGSPFLELDAERSQHLLIPDDASLRPERLTVFVVGMLHEPLQPFMPYLVKAAEWNWNGGYSLAQDDSNERLAFHVDDWDDSEVSRSVTFGQWHMADGRFTGEGLELSVQGGAPASRTYTRTRDYPASPLYIGISPDDDGTVTDPLHGRIREILLFGRALSDDEREAVRAYLLERHF